MLFPVSIIKHIISDYVDYDELLDLVKHIPEFHINVSRVKTAYTINNLRQQTKSTYIDDNLRKEETWLYNFKHCETNYKRAYIQHGKQYFWHVDTDTLAAE